MGSLYSKFKRSARGGYCYPLIADYALEILEIRATQISKSITETNLPLMDSTPYLEILNEWFPDITRAERVPMAISYSTIHEAKKLDDVETVTIAGISLLSEIILFLCNVAAECNINDPEHRAHVLVAFNKIFTRYFEMQCLGFRFDAQSKMKQLKFSPEKTDEVTERIENHTKMIVVRVKSFQ